MIVNMIAVLIPGCIVIRFSSIGCCIMVILSMEGFSCNFWKMEKEEKKYSKKLKIINDFFFNYNPKYF